MRNLASAIVLSSLLGSTGIAIQPAAAGDYYGYDGDGYYAAPPPAPLPGAPLTSDPHYRYPNYYGTVYGDGSPYYTPAPHAVAPRAYYGYGYGYSAPYYGSGYYGYGACSYPVKVYDDAGGWVWGRRIGC
jgi:hypothetical protein